MCTLTKQLLNNNLPYLYTDNLKTIFKYNNDKFNEFLDVLKNSDSILHLELNQITLNNNKIVDIINILKDKTNINTINININKKSDLSFINNINKFNNVKVILKVSTTKIIENKNFKDFIQKSNIYRYIPNTKDINDLNFIINNSNLESIDLTFISYSLNKKFFECLKNNTSINKIKINLEDDKQFIYYFSDFIKNNNPINKLVINYKNNKITNDIKPLIEAFKNNNKIQYLKLYQWRNINNFSEVFKYNNTIKTFEIYGEPSNEIFKNHIEGDDLNNDKFEELRQLAYNSYNIEFNIDNLIKSLYNNKSLENLYINCNTNHINVNINNNINDGFYYIKDNNIFNELFLKNNTLKNLKLLDCNITDITGLLNNLNNNSSIETLNLSFNKINNIDNIFEILKTNLSLKELVLIDNNIKSIDNIYKIFETNKSLLKFDITYENTIYDIEYFKDLYHKNITKNINIEIINRMDKTAEELVEEMNNNTITEISIRDYHTFMCGIF